MKATIMTLSLSLLFAAGAQAQKTADPAIAPAAQGDHHACIMAGAETWTSLGLTAEQMSKVKEIQASCSADYTSKDMEAPHETVAKHEAELKTVLTAEQYANWSKWCAERQTMTTKPGTK